MDGAVIAQRQETDGANIRKLELIESRGDSAGRQAARDVEMLGVLEKRCRRHLDHL